MPAILLIRHAENDYLKTGKLAGRLPEVHLNAAGIQQAAALSQHLQRAPKNARVGALYSSPMERARETAQPLADALNLPVHIRPALNEIDFGDWQGQALKDLRRRKDWKTVQHRPSLFTFPNGESFYQAQQRIVAELHSLAAQHAPKDVIACFSHSDLIKLAICHFSAMPLDAFQRLIIAPASVSTLLFNKDSVSVFNLNLVAAIHVEH
ncbi:MAG: histidine phosphatase family protein [Anaerolineales bacterium]